MKQAWPSQRLTGMQPAARQIAFSVIRIGILVALASLLIMGIFPAVLAVEAAT